MTGQVLTFYQTKKINLIETTILPPDVPLCYIHLCQKQITANIDIL